MNKNEKHYPLDVAMPQHCAYAVRDLPQATVEQRERALNATHWNEFAFPSGMLTVDMLSDSGTTAMTNQQLATLFLGDEAYGRNTGYYVLLDTFRDIFERGGEKNWKKILDLVRTDCRDIEKMMDEVYLCEYEGGLFNGGAAQMERPNSFIIQQGRAAESVLMEIVKKILALVIRARYSPFRLTATLTPPRAISSRWALFRVTCTTRNCCTKFRKAAPTRRIRSRATWISRSSSS